jgi:starvation-inducible DNA-binding protein
VAAQRSSLVEYPLKISAGKDHVDALSNALAAFGKLVRSAIDQTAELGDVDTSDLFTEVSRAIDKQLWFVEAHLHSNT